MQHFIYRNTTIEHLFGNDNVCYSGYDDILTIDLAADLFIWFYLLPIKSDRESIVAEIESYSKNIRFIYDNISASKPFLIFTLQEFYGVTNRNDDFSVELAINAFNADIVAFAKQHKNVKIISISDFTRNYTNEQWIDWKYYFTSKIYINPHLAKPFKNWFAKQVDAILGIRKKCLILDLDNTLWGGILGEDGIEGIRIGGDYPGNAFSQFQQSLLELTNTGIILAVCSKNNEQDVLDAWQKNPFLILREEHFATYKINWDNKADNIKAIAQTLNIGLESIVFVDDNPTERELIKQVLPMVAVPEFPVQPYLLPIFFEQLQNDYFSVYSITEEDKTKTEQYKANAQRESMQHNFTNITDYLASLNINITIQKADDFNIPRIAQLTQKTNQFNLTTKRYTESNIHEFIHEGGLVFCINVKDIFGDNGIVGVIILKKIDEVSFEIDSLLLSCRVLGKGIEKAFVLYILNILKKQSVRRVSAQYFPTNKNVQVKDFYERIGFMLNNEKSESKSYTIILEDNDFIIEPYLKIEIK